VAAVGLVPVEGRRGKERRGEPRRSLAGLGGGEGRASHSTSKVCAFFAVGDRGKKEEEEEGGGALRTCRLLEREGEERARRALSCALSYRGARGGEKCGTYTRS